MLTWEKGSKNLTCELCKESSVLYPGASVFCYWASEFGSQLARWELVKFFKEFNLQKNCVVKPAHQKVSGAS